MNRTLLNLSAMLTLMLCRLGDATEFEVIPAKIDLAGRFEQSQLVVSEPGATDRSVDQTPRAVFVTSDSAVARVSAKGRVVAVGAGRAMITVRIGDVSRQIPVVVAGDRQTSSVGFSQHVGPILSKAGCNMGACHASQHGKGGFKLSVFGFEPEKDQMAIVRDRRQRRINFLEPELSLILRKPTLQVPHGGGKRLEFNSVDHQILAEWIRQGCPAPRRTDARLVELSVSPQRRVASTGQLQQLRVLGKYSDGQIRDVTAWAQFDSMDDGVVGADSDGRAEVVGKGQAAILVRFDGRARIAQFVVPYNQAVDLSEWQSVNFVDELAAAKFQELGLKPSGLCDDATFIRRAFLSAIGQLPTVAQVREFIESQTPDKRTKLVDRLLGFSGDEYNDNYAAFWTLKWSDLIRNTSNKLGEQGMWALHNWLKESFRTNRPMNEVVRELVTAKGSIYRSGPANYFRINSNSSDLTESTAQLFLGVRLQCAKCHHHPFEKYGQEDYYGFAAFFARVGTKGSEEFGLFGREQVVVVKTSGDIRHPRTGQLMKPTALGEEPTDHPLDRRIPLAEWLASPENKFFARSIVNRYMGYLLGRGLVEPIDDMRETNPPSNVALMEALSRHFVESGFNLKQLMRAIMVSRLFQLDSQPTEENASDRRFYSHFRVRRLAAEPLLDAVDFVTGVQTKFRNLPLGTRAVQLPDAEYPNYFLNTFAKPKRASVCECERSGDESLAQALHTLNGDILFRKIGDKNGRLAKLVAANKSPAEILEEIFLATLARVPSPREIDACQGFLKESPNLQEGFEDILWALMNSKQFLFLH